MPAGAYRRLPLPNEDSGACIKIDNIRALSGGIAAGFTTAARGDKNKQILKTSERILFAKVCRLLLSPPLNASDDTGRSEVVESHESTLGESYPDPELRLKQ